MKIGLISCTKKKQSYNCIAKDMYSKSALFKKALLYCSQNYDDIYILSAKYGVLKLYDKIEPYNKTVKSFSKSEKIFWAQNCFNQIKKIFTSPNEVEFYFHTGKDYSENLNQMLTNLGFKCFTPLEGLTIGPRLKWYNCKNEVQK